MAAAAPPVTAIGIPRWAVAGIAALAVVAVGYTFYRAAVVRLEYFDGYQFLVGARRMAGDRSMVGFNLTRPPLLSLLDVPAVWLARRGAPANLAYTLGPHLVAALLAVLSGLAVVYAFAAALDRRLALLGGTLFLTGRLFVRYGAFTMADILSMGFGALALGLYARSLARPSWGKEVLAGVAIGLGAAAKWPLLLMGAVMVLAEVLLAAKRRRLSLRRVGGLAVTGVTSAASFVGVVALVFALGEGFAALGRFPAAFLSSFTAAAGYLRPLPGESKWDYATFVRDGIAWPLLALAAVGIVFLVKDRRERDLPFFAWLAGLGGLLVATAGHNEARYLFPVFPAVLYFSVRGLEELLLRLPSRRVAGAAALGLAVLCCWGGARQAWADRDPVFRADFQRQTAAALWRLRRPGGRLRWVGPFACVYPLARLPLAHDEFFNSFHFYGPATSYFLGEAAEPLDALTYARDGDAVAVGGPNCDGQALPATPPVPWRIHGVARRPLARDARTGAWTSAAGDLSVRVTSAPSGLALRLTGARPPGPGAERYLVVSDPSPRLLRAPAGDDIPYGSRDASGLTVVEVMELTTETIATR